MNKITVKEESVPRSIIEIGDIFELVGCDALYVIIGKSGDYYNNRTITFPIYSTKSGFGFEFKSDLLNEKFFKRVTGKKITLVFET